MAPFAAEPFIVESGDGTRIAVFECLPARVAGAGATNDAVTRETNAGAATGAPARDGQASSDPPPLLLIHGATADHTTWRAVGPRLALRRRVYAMDRRGRGASGDADGYAIEREFEDVAAVADALASATPPGAVDVAGHSYGGRCGLGASLLARSIRRLVVYEGAPVPPGMSYRPPGLVEGVRAALDRGDRDAALTTFLAGIVGMSEAALDAYRADPVWPARVAAAHTILREVEAEASDAASLEALQAVRVPVLLLLGSISRSPFRIGTQGLARRLPDARVAVIDGAAHAAHHTHAPEFVRIVEDFLDRPLAAAATIPA